MVSDAGTVYLMNDLIHFPDMDLNIARIKGIVFDNQFNFPEEAARHHRRVDDHPYLKSIREEYPFLSSVYNVYTVMPGEGLPLHIDAKRKASFNIPVSGTAGTSTIFYKPIGEVVTEYDNVLVANRVISPVEELFRFTLSQPMFIDTTVPHEVINPSDYPRVTLSWGVDDRYTLNDIKCML